MADNGLKFLSKFFLAVIPHFPISIWGQPSISPWPTAERKDFIEQFPCPLRQFIAEHHTDWNSRDSRCYMSSMLRYTDRPVQPHLAWHCLVRHQTRPLQTWSAAFQLVGWNSHSHEISAVYFHVSWAPHERKSTQYLQLSRPTTIATSRELSDVLHRPIFDTPFPWQTAHASALISTCGKRGPNDISKKSPPNGENNISNVGYRHSRFEWYPNSVSEEKWHLTSTTYDAMKEWNEAAIGRKQIIVGIKMQPTNSRTHDKRSCSALQSSGS